MTNNIDFEFSPEIGWEYEEGRWAFPIAELPLSPEDVRSMVLSMAFGLGDEDMGDAIAGVKSTTGGAWVFRYADSFGNQFGTVRADVEDGKAFLVVRMETL